MGKTKPKKKSKVNKKQRAYHDLIRRSIEGVSNDVELTVVDVPTDEKLDDEDFPNPDNFHPPSNSWLCNDMVNGVGEWGEAWLAVLDAEEPIDYNNEDYGVFSKLSKKKKEEYRKKMVEIVRKDRRALMYKKWTYVKAAQEAVLEWNEGWNDDDEGGGDDDVTDVEVDDVTGGELEEESEAIVEDDDVNVASEKDVGGGDDDVIDVTGGELEEESEAIVEDDDVNVASEKDVGGGDDDVIDVTSGECEEKSEVIVEDDDVNVASEKDVGGGDDDVTDVEVDDATGGEREEESEAIGEDEVRANLEGEDNGDDPYPAVGYYPYADPFTPPDCDCDFPKFNDKDVILYYREPFSLASWFKNHHSVDLRWSSEYTNWGGNKMTREGLAVVQSLVTGVLDDLEANGAHGKLEDMLNYKLTQYIENYGGVKKVRFRTELLHRDKSIDANWSLKTDISQFIQVLHELFKGGVLDNELQQLLILLNQYPFPQDSGWKKLVLRNFPALWDGHERVSFYMNLYNRFVTDVSMRTIILNVYQDGTALHRGPSLYGWIAKIPPNTYFDHILRKSGEGVWGSTSQGVQGSSQGSTSQAGASASHIGAIYYSEGSVSEIVKYVRAVLHHFNQKPGGRKVDVREVELKLSQMFGELLLSIYVGMCVNKIFLS